MNLTIVATDFSLALYKDGKLVGDTADDIEFARLVADTLGHDIDVIYDFEIDEDGFPANLKDIKHAKPKN